MYTIHQMQISPFGENCHGLLTLSDKIIIVGDRNVDLLNTSDTQIIYDIISDCHLVNIIKDATRITNSTRTLIDPILQHKAKKLLNREL